MNREEITKRVMETFHTNKKLCLQFPTGTGKSLIALRLASSSDLNITNPDSGKKILILIAERAHKQLWKDEFMKWGYESLLKDTLIITYASLHKVYGEYSVIIADEVHHLCTEKRLSLFLNLSSPVFLGLSATVGRDRFRALQAAIPDAMLLSISLQETIDKGILPDPEINVIPLILDNTKPTQEIIKMRGKKEKRKVIHCTYREMWDYIKNKLTYPDIELHVKCTERQKYDAIDSEWYFWKQKYLTSRQEFMKNKWMLAGTQRKRYLGELKTAKVKELIESLPKDERFICFCTSIEQQIELAKSYNYINSELKDCQNVINTFNEKRFNSLYCVGMAQEGLNLVDVPTGIIVQLDAELRRFIQKVGRLLRADHPRIYVFYYKHTRDEEFLEKVKELLPNIK